MEYKQTKNRVLGRGWVSKWPTDWGKRRQGCICIWSFRLGRGTLKTSERERKEKCSMTKPTSSRLLTAFRLKDWSRCLFTVALKCQTRVPLLLALCCWQWCCCLLVAPFCPGEREMMLRWTTKQQGQLKCVINKGVREWDNNMPWRGPTDSRSD